jgi:hypothetical protein
MHELARDWTEWRGWGAYNCARFIGSASFVRTVKANGSLVIDKASGDGAM